MRSFNHEYILGCEALDANGMLCQECAGMASGDKLFTYSTIRGARVRPHEGVFCCVDCHDRWYGLKPRG
jgi:hypothetical protein